MDKNIDKGTEAFEARTAAVANKAPRITLEEIKSQVTHVEYVKHVSLTGQVMRWAVMTMKNGFGLTGKPGVAVSPLNDNEEIGQKVAYDNAINEMWPLLGYELRSKLHLIETAPAPQDGIALFGSDTGGGPAVKTYIGTKVVHAVPMNRAQYNALRGWNVPEDEDPMDEGYLVEYTDGGKPNLKGFTGYVSWSPRDVFERSYTVGTGPRPETFIDRLRKEVARLDNDIQKLGNFINGSVYKELPLAEQADQKNQLHHMSEYRWFVANRLRRLGVDPK